MLSRVYVVTLAACGALALSSAGCATRNDARPPGARDGEAAPAGIAARLDAILPGLADSDPARREQAQRDFDDLCAAAGDPAFPSRRVALCGAIVERLSPPVPHGARPALLAGLARLGDDESVPALANLLSDPEPSVRDAARRALQHNPSPAAGKALAAALAAHRDRQPAFVNALAARREARAEGRLIALLDGAEPDLRAAVISALGEIATPRAEAALRALQSASADDRAGAIDALLRTAEHCMRDGAMPRAAAIYRDLAADADAHVRLAALRGLACADGEAALPRLVAVLSAVEEDDRTLLTAARIVQDMPGSEAGEALVRLLEADLLVAARVAVLDALALRGDRGAAAAVLALARADDAEVSMAALRALKWLGDERHVADLLSLAARADAPRQAAVVETLSRLRGENVSRALLSALIERAAPAAARVVLIRALSERDYAPALDALLVAAQDADEAVASAAFDALARACPADRLEAVLDALRASRPGARPAAEDALVAVGQRRSDASARLRPLVAALESGADAVTGAALVRVIGRLGGPGALEPLRASLRSADVPVRDAAVRAIAAWPDADALDDLQQVVEHSAAPNHRALALRGGTRLLRERRELGEARRLELLRRFWELAAEDSERRLLLSALGELGSADALAFAQAAMRREALQNEAAAAVAGVARRLSAHDARGAQQALAELDNRPLSPGVLNLVRQAREFIERHDGYIARWSFVGPFTLDGGDYAAVFVHEFPPEQAEAACGWRFVGPDRTPPGWRTLGAAAGDNP
ncbi:MAG TPA: HEAT repeat domain-containing protein, partial [Phycisphaerae bacterium]|nr:HEAT repeat domain-containing protein [Phycisphaerae bacterium]